MTTPNNNDIRFVDLFCGIGGFHIGVTNAATSLGLGAECVFASDIDPYARRAYEENFGLRPAGDITVISEDNIPEHDLLCAGFPCQPFSVFGKMRGFEDTRGTLFFEIVRILKARQPAMFILENVKQLTTHHRGETLAVILEALDQLGYYRDYRVLDARDFGLPQKRERVIITGRLKSLGKFSFEWPEKNPRMTPLAEILETNPPDSYTASERIRSARKNRVNGNLPDGPGPFIYHENKSGNIAVYPYSCALRAGSSYNYLLVDGTRRLTGREMLRLQGFPDSFRIVCSYSQTRKQAGNAVPVAMVEAVAKRLLGASRLNPA